MDRVGAKLAIVNANTQLLQLKTQIVRNMQQLKRQ